MRRFFLLMLLSNLHRSAQSLETRVVYAYLHGFLSSSASAKGQLLKRAFSERYGAELHLLDLNEDGHASTLTYSGGIRRVEAFIAGQEAVAGGAPLEVRLIGSSLGGYVAAAVAERRPDCVSRALLLCPGFDMAARWPTLFDLDDWRAKGRRAFRRESDGASVEVPYAFITDGLQQKAFPRPSCPVCIVHGTRDTTVPPSASEDFLGEPGSASSRTTRAVFVDDDHALLEPSTTALTLKLAESLFGLTGADGGAGGAGGGGPIEVEAKFTVAEDRVPALLRAVEAEGAAHRFRDVFFDSYWDFAGDALTRENCWLRCRSGAWELKVPVEGADGGGGGGGGAVVYREIVGETAVRAWLSSRGRALDARRSMADALRGAGGVEFAAFGTSRTKLEAGGLSIDVDSASFGHCVVEIEALCADAGGVPQAREAVHALAQRLGLAERSERIGGKVEEFLRRFDGERYARLARHGVLAAECT